MTVRFADDLTFIRETHQFMQAASLGLHRHRGLLNNITTLGDSIRYFLAYEFDPDDDITQLKKQAQKDLKQLEEIKKEIP